MTAAQWIDAMTPDDCRDTQAEYVEGALYLVTQPHCREALYRAAGGWTLSPDESAEFYDDSSVWAVSAERIHTYDPATEVLVAKADLRGWSGTATAPSGAWSHLVAAVAKRPP